MRGPGLLMVAVLVLGAGGNRAADHPATGVGQEEVVVDREAGEIIRGALKYLALEQKPNGSWVDGKHEEWSTAITGYALMAFVASGNLPNEGEYAKTVAAGTQYLLDSLQSDGKFNTAKKSGQYMYGHGIATIVLAELYGQTRSEVMRPKLEKAIKLILDSQNQEGGWRYHPFPKDADISVTVLQAVALRAAKDAGLDVPQETLDRAVKYVDSCYDEKTGGFSYQPKQGAGFARTAAAIYSLQVLGRYDDPRVKTGSEFIERRRHQKEEHFAYGHFYAAPAQYMIGGETWKKWYLDIRDQLIKQAHRQGDIVYWDPPDQKSVGPVYCTAVYGTILAIPYHYVPLYQR